MFIWAQGNRRDDDMHRIFVIIMLAVAGCTPINGGADPADGRTAARFSERPDDLFAALEATCSDPSDTFVRESADRVQCRSFLPPEPTAALILNYDGTLDDLPKLVVQFSGQRDVDGYVLENSYYVSVPQKRGPALQVRQGDWLVERRMRALMRAAGGSPV